MNIKEWSKAFGILPTHPTTEKQAVSVVLDISGEAHRALYRLSDYKVSSVCGIVVWLVPIKKCEVYND